MKKMQKIMIALLAFALLFAGIGSASAVISEELEDTDDLVLLREPIEFPEDPFPEFPEDPFPYIWLYG